MNDLFTALLETYEQNQQIAGKEIDGVTLLPISHEYRQAHIEITITADGAFHAAQVLKKENIETIVPITIESGSRSSAIAPHALCDTLSYVASHAQLSSDKHTAYMEALNAWQSSKYSHPYVKAVYRYISGESMLRDLSRSNILSFEKNGCFSDKKIYKAIPQQQAFVRFSVFDAGQVIPLYQNREVFNSWINYYESTLTDTGLCYLTGKKGPLTHIHPAGIRYAGDRARLISANDRVGFTFRGRFSTSKDAVQMSYDASQKIHSALKWLIRKTNYTFGEDTVLVWCENGPDIQNPYLGSVPMVGFPETEEEYNMAVSAYFRYQKAALLKKGVNTVHVAHVSAATKGRLSVPVFYSLPVLQYLKNVETWFQSCCWRMHVWNDKTKRMLHYVGSPELKEIINLSLVTNPPFSNIPNEAKSSALRTLSSSMIMGTPIDRAFVRKLMKNHTKSEYEPWFRNKILDVGCAVIRKSRMESFGEEWSM